jgi:hypothetical protein
LQLPYLKTFDFQIQANATLIVYCRILAIAMQKESAFIQALGK